MIVREHAYRWCCFLTTCPWMLGNCHDMTLILRSDGAGGVAFGIHLLVDRDERKAFDGYMYVVLSCGLGAIWEDVKTAEGLDGPAGKFSDYKTPH